MVTKVYSDLGKTTKKILSDDYPTDLKVSAKMLASNGVNVTVDTVQSAKSETLASTTTLKAKVFGNPVTTKISSSGKLTAEATLDQLGVSGVKTVLSAGALGGQSTSATAKLEYLHHHLAATTLIDFFKGPSFHSSAALGLGAVTVGGDVSYDTAKSGFTKYSTTITRVEKDSEMTVTATDGFNTIKASYSHAIADQPMVVAGEILLDRASGSKCMTMGAKYSVDPKTSAKAKLSSNGSLSLAYVCSLRPNTSVVMSTAVDLKKLHEGTLSSPKIGLSVTYE